LLKIKPKRNGARGIGRKAELRDATPLLAELNITHDQASDWQKLAAVPERQFEIELQKPGVPTKEQIHGSLQPQFVSEKFRNII
jgi:hypothetical protein